MPSVSVKIFLHGHLVPRVLSAFLRSERWVGKYPAKQVTFDGCWCIQSTVSLKQAAQLMLQLNQGCWDVIYEYGYYFHPLKQNLYLKITLVIRLATRSGTCAPYKLILLMTHLKTESGGRYHHRMLSIPKTFHSDQILRSSRRPHFSRNFTAHYAFRNADLNLIPVVQRQRIQFWNSEFFYRIYAGAFDEVWPLSY